MAAKFIVSVSYDGNESEAFVPFFFQFNVIVWGLVCFSKTGAIKVFCINI